MRRKALLALPLLFSLTFIQAQTAIPNGDFEQWAGNKPTGWDASNFTYLTFTLQTVFRDTVLPLSGSNSVTLETKTFNILTVQPTIPGLITLGKIVLNMSNFTGSVEDGIPFSGRPLSLKGYIHALPANGDSAMIAVGFSKWNGVKRDTIGEGLAWFATPHIEWVPFDIPLYFNSPVTPDSLNIIISCSAVANEVMVPGSKAHIDNLSFDYGNVIIEQGFGANDLAVWAEGGQLHYRISSSIEPLVEIQVSDIAGKMVSAVTPEGEGRQGSVNLGRLPSGIYVMSAITSGGRHLSRKFVVR